MTNEPQLSFLTESRKWMALAILLLTGWLLYLLAPVLTPFIMGAVIAYLGDPLVDRLENKKVPRTLGVLIVFLIFSAVIVVSLLMLIPLVERQLVIVYQSIPGFLEWLNTTAIPWVKVQTGLSLEILEPGAFRNALEAHMQTAGTVLANFLAGVGTSGMALAVWLTNLVLVPVVAFYLMRDWDILIDNLREMLPRNRVSTVTQLAQEMDEVLGAFLRGQMLVMLALGIIYSVGLWSIGLNVALIVGMIAGLASIVPYLGFIVGIVAAAVAAVLQFGDLTSVIYVLIVFGIGQTLESVVLTPLLVGDKIGLHPVAVIFAIMAGGQLFGFVGILVALPVAAIIMVLLRHMHSKYKSSDIYSVDDTIKESLNPEIGGSSELDTKQQDNKTSDDVVSSKLEGSKQEGFNQKGTEQEILEQKALEQKASVLDKIQQSKPD